jgi:hypothetical protein
MRSEEEEFEDEGEEKEDEITMIDDLNGEFEIDVERIEDIARLAQRWRCEHEKGREALNVLEAAREELSNSKKTTLSTEYHDKVKEKIKSIFPSDDMLNCLMKKGKYAINGYGVDADELDLACETLRTTIEEMESIRDLMKETFQTWTDSFENGGVCIIPTKTISNEESDEDHGDEEEEEEKSIIKAVEKEERGRGRESSSRRPRGRSRQRREVSNELIKRNSEKEADEIARRLSFLETVNRDNDDGDDDIICKVETATLTLSARRKKHWMQNIPTKALFAKFSLINSTTSSNSDAKTTPTVALNPKPRTFEQWLFLCANASESVAKELRVKQVVCERALELLRGGGGGNNNKVNNDDFDFNLLIDAWDVQAFIDDSAFEALCDSV